MSVGLVLYRTMDGNVDGTCIDGVVWGSHVIGACMMVDPGRPSDPGALRRRAGLAPVAGAPAPEVGVVNDGEDDAIDVRVLCWMTR